MIVRIAILQLDGMWRISHIPRTINMVDGSVHHPMDVSFRNNRGEISSAHLFKYGKKSGTWMYREVYS